VSFIHGKEKTGQHNDNHCHSRKGRPRAAFEQKEKRQSHKESRAQTNDLPFRKVKCYFGFDFG